MAKERTVRSAAGGLSEDFLARCQQAALMALLFHDLRQLRAKVPDVGVAAQPVADYLRLLASIARLPLDAVLGWAQFALNAPADVASTGWGRLARALGLDLRQARVHFRLTFAAQFAHELLPDLVSHRAESAGPPDPLAVYERFLDEQVSNWSVDLQQRLFACEEEMFKSYQQAANLLETPT